MFGVVGMGAWFPRPRIHIPPPNWRLLFTKHLTNTKNEGCVGQLFFTLITTTRMKHHQRKHVHIKTAPPTSQKKHLNSPDSGRQRYDVSDIRSDVTHSGESLLRFQYSPRRVDLIGNAYFELLTGSVLFPCWSDRLLLESID